MVVRARGQRGEDDEDNGREHQGVHAGPVVREVAKHQLPDNLWFACELVEAVWEWQCSSPYRADERNVADVLFRVGLGVGRAILGSQDGRDGADDLSRVPAG